MTLDTATPTRRPVARAPVVLACAATASSITSDLVGGFRVDCEFVNPRQPRRSAWVRQLVVDSGSEFTWVQGNVLQRIGVRLAKKDQQFVLANGQTITRSLGYAIIRAAEFETIDEVVFAQPGDLSLLGARTLEGCGAHVDARRKRLVAAGPHLAAGRLRR